MKNYYCDICKEKLPYRPVYKGTKNYPEPKPSWMVYAGLSGQDWCKKCWDTAIDAVYKRWKDYGELTKEI